MTSSVKRKYVTYRNTAREGPSHSRQRKKSEKIGEEWTCSVVGDLLADRRTHRQTDTLNTVLRFRGAAEVTKQLL